MNKIALGIAVVISIFQNSIFAQIFPDAHEISPVNWKGKIFKLSQNYPTLLTTENLPWKSIDFKSKPIDYLMAVRQYAYEGNVENDWNLENNYIRKWFHAPWMHAGPFGREFVRGLTRERDSRPKELHIQQTTTKQNWAVGMYNSIGGFTIGEVWKDPSNPDPTKSFFPEGTVSIKLIFTNSTLEEVPFLQNSVEWEANINETLRSEKRVISKVHLLQMDVAIRDSRVDDTTGWIFGTFIYDSSAPGSTAWERMVPVGLMWGNDPGITADMISSGSSSLKETIINNDLKIKTNLGWGGRLNGPVDNPTSSCLSCHSTAQIYSSNNSGMAPRTDLLSNEKLNWFRNIKSNEPFDEGAISLNYSLQLQSGIKSFLNSRGN